MTKRPKRAFAISNTDDRPLVAVVDDDESVRESLPDLLKQFGFVTKAFGSAREFLSSGDLSEFHCLLLDVSMPSMSGPELQHALVSQGRRIPIVFLTAHVEGDLRARLLAQGAVECLFKPFTEGELQAALNAAIHQR
jgi:FixJ family two-component response regulator